MRPPAPGWVSIAAAHWRFCPACDSHRRMQLRITAHPRSPRGGPYSCPLCSGGAGAGRPPIHVLQPPAWRQETPRGSAA